MLDRGMIRSLEPLHNAHHEGYACHVVAAHDPAWPTAAHRVVDVLHSDA